ncbi:MAG: anti-sigma regulatory factor [Treponemataceae bacterium]|nr:MAG: anti-sigma regulatory factor [Treponemataceae bacterium]
MTEFHYSAKADNYSQAGSASIAVKRELDALGIDKALIRRVAVAMYEGEINMVIHAGGGEIAVEVDDDKIIARLDDNGPGIPDIGLAMEEGYSTASEKIHESGFGAGMGLANMKRNCDILNIIPKPDGGMSITMIFFITRRHF